MWTKSVSRVHFTTLNQSPRLEWEQDGVRYTNHYILGYPAFGLEQMKKWVGRIAEFSGKEDFVSKVGRLSGSNGE